MDIEELGDIERCSLPGSGSCGKYSVNFSAAVNHVYYIYTIF